MRENLRKGVKKTKNCKKNQIRKLGFLLDIAKEEDKDIIVFLGLLKK